MKIVDVATVLLNSLPNYTDRFFDTYSITSLTRSSNTVTAVTSAPHGLLVNDYISITGALLKNPIVSLTRSGSIATAVTANNHDLTEDWIQNTVSIIGANQAGYNGSHTLLSVPNRKTFTFSVDSSTVTPGTGTIFLLDDNNYLNSYNGLKPITAVPTTTSFQYAIPSGSGLAPLPYSPAYGTIIGMANYRIGAVLNFDEAQEWYFENVTSEGLGKYWIFITFGKTDASKSRFTLDDAVSNSMRGQVYRIRLITQFNVYVFAPIVKNAQTKLIEYGRELIDYMTNDLRAALVKSICRYTFPSPFAESSWSRTALVSDETENYNNSTYIHRYVFENTEDVTYPDTIPPSSNVAFRDIDFNFLNSETGDTIASAEIDLDDDPLP